MIAGYSENYLNSVQGGIDLDVVRKLYYLTCKFDNILYLDDAHDKTDSNWNEYKIKFQSQAAKVASLLIQSEYGKDKLMLASKNLDSLYDNIPLRLPSGLPSNDRFGAYYTSLKYDLEWDKHWRIGDHADIAVSYTHLTLPTNREV